MITVTIMITTTRIVTTTNTSTSEATINTSHIVIIIYCELFIIIITMIDVHEL